ncbi:MAG: hypothetical protein IID53_00945 [Proteobacteria bacterium]|nr:hypothetical protein [Pseudomonadota bacterium]
MTTEVPPPAGRGKVPVWRTAIGSYGFVFGNLDRFFALGWLLLVITFAVNMASGFLIEVGGGESRSLADWVTYIALSAASWAMYLVFAVRWHRFFLLGERESVFTDVLGTRNWRFLGYTVLLTFAPIVPMFVIGFVSFGVFVSVVETQGAGAVELALILLFGLSGIAMFILLFVMFRFYLVLPGTAVDRPLTLGEAWRNMRGNSWRFIGAFFFVSIPLIIAALILATFGGISEFASATGGASEPTIGVLVVTNALMAIIGFFVMAVGVTVLSKFYRHIVGMDAPGGGAHVLAEGP